MKMLKSLSFAVLLAGSCPCSLLADDLPADAESSVALRTLASGIVAKAGDQMVIQGKEDWLFFVPELRHLAAGPFWGEAAAKASRATRPEWADPLPAIVDFGRQVKAAGAVLLFVPVPPKAVIYPDKLPGSTLEPSGQRADEAQANFLAALREAGVETLDLAPIFLAHRQAQGDGADQLLFCRTDTHWSPLACEVTAAAIHDRTASLLTGEPAKREFERRTQDITFTGDISQLLPEAERKPETLPAKFVIDPATGEPPADFRESPLLLVGDSHLLVFHVGGDMHATGTGLADQIASRLGYAPDVVGVRGSGASPSRIALLRRRDNLAGKQVVVWLLTSREYTETQGWRPVPVVSLPPKP